MMRRGAARLGARCTSSVSSRPLSSAHQPSGGRGGLRVLRALGALCALRHSYQRPLQRLIQLEREDVVDPLALQVRQKRILTEPGVRPQQPDGLPARFARVACKKLMTLLAVPVLPGRSQT